MGLTSEGIIQDLWNWRCAVTAAAQRLWKKFQSWGGETKLNAVYYGVEDIITS